MRKGERGESRSPPGSGTDRYQSSYYHVACGCGTILFVVHTNKKEAQTYQFVVTHGGGHLGHLRAGGVEAVRDEARIELIHAVAPGRTHAGFGAPGETLGWFTRCPLPCPSQDPAHEITTSRPSDLLGMELA